MNAIKTIKIAGFRSLKDVRFEPGRVTLLIGANGSGKSNVLGVFRLLAAIHKESLALFVAREGGASAVLHRGAKVTPAMKLEIVLENRLGPSGPVRVEYEAELGWTQGDRLVFVDETAVQDPSDGGSVGHALGSGHGESRMGEKETGGVAQTVADAIRSVAFYHFHDTSPLSALRTNARAIEHYSLLPDGRNLAAYLLGLRQAKDEAGRASWGLVNALVKRIAPFITRLVPTPVNADPATFRLDDPNGNLDKVTVRLDWVDDQGDQYGVQHLSDGTLRAVALFAALTQPGTRLPAVISIDEPELGLHPAAVAALVDVIRSVSDRCQVVLATQSPALLDYFAPEEVVVAERVNGATQLRRLDAEGLAGWMEDYSLSELYDKNVLGGRP